MTEINAFEQMSDIMEIQAIHEELNDPDVDRALLKLASILQNPEINPARVSRHIVECDALAMRFALKAKYYMSLGKDEENYRVKKEFYHTLREEMHRLADSLKYLVRSQL